jgi:hypothetical protein
MKTRPSAQPTTLGPMCGLLQKRQRSLRAPAHFSLALGALLGGAAVVIGQPVITQQPQSCTNNAGTTASFTVGATGTKPLGYQWQKYVGGFTNLTDRTNATLVLTNVQTSDDADYRAVVTNLDGATNSAPAHLYVLVPPRITKVTNYNASVSLGAPVKMQVWATGTSPLSYQWWFGGLALARQTNVILNLTSVQTTIAGLYTVVVTNWAGSASTNVSLDVDPTFTKITTGPLVTEAAHWHGAAWADYDNDGYPDVFIHQQAPVVADFIFHNNGDGTFTRLSAPIPQGLTSYYGAWGNAWGDYDNDGHLDLILANRGGNNVLLHNRGDGTFEHILTGPGADGSATTAAAWGDYDRDGYLDLFAVNSNDGVDTGVNALYHNEGNGTFSKMTASRVGPIVSDRAMWESAGWVDLKNDGWPWLFAVTADSKARLYDNLANGSFGLVTNNALVGSTVPTATFAWADYDNAGRLDVCVPGIGTPTLLFHQETDGTFRQMSPAQVGVPPSDRSQMGAVAWGDYDNDGFVDLFVGGGGYDASMNAVVTKSFLYHNNGDGTFTPVRTGSPVIDPCDSMGVLWVDYNRDGFLDLFVQPHGVAKGYAQNLLYRNNGNSNNWLCVTCVGTASPRDGTGANLRALATIRGKPMWQLRLINSGGTSFGGQSFVAHFGLGDATNVDVLRIEWTSGTVQELYSIPAKQYLTVTEPARLSMPSLGQLHIQCWKGMAYRIEASPDLLTWTPQATVTNLNLKGGIQWTDPGVPGPSARFYRTIKQ